MAGIVPVNRQNGPFNMTKSKQSFNSVHSFWLAVRSAHNFTAGPVKLANSEELVEEERCTSTTQHPQDLVDITANLKLYSPYTFN